MPKIIPDGSDHPRCPVHEPEKLWLEAEAAYKARHPDVEQS